MAPAAWRPWLPGRPSASLFFWSDFAANFDTHRMADSQNRKQLMLSVLVFASGFFIGKFFELSRQAKFSTDIGDAEIARVMAQSKVLHVGGQHRGGTTLTWDGLQQHPDVSSFSTVSRELDEDFDEDEGTGVDAIEKELQRRRLDLYPHITQFRSEGV